MTRPMLLIAAVLAGAALFVAGVILGRSEERAPVVWREGDDGILPVDPWLASWTAS